jgi:hypothetical protein
MKTLHKLMVLTYWLVFRDYKAFELGKTLCSLENYDFSPIFKVQCLNSIITSVFHDFVPLKRCSIKNEVNPWMNFEISTLIAQRDIAYNIWDKHKTDENRALFLLLS